MHPVGHQHFFHPESHIRVHRRHHLIFQLHDSNIPAFLYELFGHFQTDEPGTDEQRFFGLVRFRVTFNFTKVLDVADVEDIIVFSLIERWRRQRSRTCRENQHIISVLFDFAGLQIFNLNLFGFMIHFRHSVFCKDGDIISLFEPFRISWCQAIH